MRKTCLAVAMLALILNPVPSVEADELRVVPFTSFWKDFRAEIPDGWRAGYDEEGTHYTLTLIRGPGSYESLSVRWYGRYATHRMVDGLLEMYSGPEDFATQRTGWYRNDHVVEAPREIAVAGRKATRFVGRISRMLRDDKNVILERRSKLGGPLVGDDEARTGGRQVWTVVAMPSGFYVLAYYSPDENRGRYDGYYERMLASFVPLKDGAGGAWTAEGNAAQAAAAGAASPSGAPAAETPENRMERYVVLLKSRRDNDRKPVCTEETDVYATRRTVCRLFASESLRKEIIEFASTMKPAPAIPDRAQVLYIQGNTIMKSAKGVSDYNTAVNKYQEALFEAPWWGDAYSNLAMALNSAGQPELAKQALEMYILTKPADAAQAKKMIIEMEARQELERERESALKAKYGGGQGSGFGWEALFRYGASVQRMSFDASGNERTISLKIATRKENGLLQNYFQITDITSSSDIFARKFSMDWRGTDTFFLDDRTLPKKELMTFTVTAYGDGDANVTLRPANNASASIKTNLTALLRERASQAVYAGDKLTVGDKEFYVLGQGGATGSLLFFPVEIKSRIESAPPQDLMPALVANVNYRGSDGTNKSYTNTDLGDVNGTHYHLEHVGNYWEAKVGRGEAH